MLFAIYKLVNDFDIILVNKNIDDNYDNYL